MAEWLNMMLSFVLEPLSYGFFGRGLLAGLAVALACGLLSGFVVWRGMAFLGDALAHAVLPGIVLAVIFGFHILIGALAAALLSVLGIGSITRQRGFKDDTAIGVIFTGAFALGIVLMNRVATFRDLSHVLFGSILGVGFADLIIIMVIALVVALAIFLFYKELLVSSFDHTHSTAIGLSPGLIHYGLLVLIAVTTVIASQTVGVVLVLALLVTPAAAASLLVRRLTRVLTLSVLFSLIAVVGGFYTSWYLDLASGAAIVLFLSLIFLIAFIYRRIRELLS